MNPTSPRPISVPATLDLNNHNSLEWLTHRGFAPPEPHGSWTNARDAQLSFIIEPSYTGDLTLTLEVAAFLHPMKLLEQRVAVSVNGVSCGTWTIREPGWHERQISLPVLERHQGAIISLGFVIPTSRSPADLEISDDIRQLGIMIRRLRFNPISVVPSYTALAAASDSPFESGSHAALTGWIEMPLIIREGFIKIEDSARSDIERYLFTLPGKDRAFLDGRPHATEFTFGAGWSPVLLYTGFPEVYLLELSNSDGRTATWILDTKFHHLAPTIDSIPEPLLEALRVVAYRILTRYRREAKLEGSKRFDPEVGAFLQLSERIRHEIAIALAVGIQSLTDDEESVARSSCRAIASEDDLPLIIAEGFKRIDAPNRPEVAIYVFTLPSPSVLSRKPRRLAKEFTFVLNWSPHFLYTGFPGIYLLEIRHVDGGAGTWILDSNLNNLAHTIEAIPSPLLEQLCAAAYPLVTRYARIRDNGGSFDDVDKELSAFLQLNENIREQVVIACWRAFRPALEGSKPTPNPRKIVSLCFSGHPRVFLNYKDSWEKIFDSFRERYELRLFFHAWANRGLLKMAGGHFAEGQYEVERFSSFGELLDFVNPSSFMIESKSDELEEAYQKFDPVLLSFNQASKYAILSQLYSIEKADKLRRRFDKDHGESDVVFRLRFDLSPDLLDFSDVEYLIAHPDVPVIFAPSAETHVHPGGGAGCRVCNKFFLECRETPNFLARLGEFFSNHGHHGNDICDIYALGNARMMSVYSSMFSRSSDIWQKIRSFSALTDISEIPTRGDPGNLQDSRIAPHGHDYEERIHCFYPEKLLRFGTEGALVVDSQSIFRLRRT